MGSPKVGLVGFYGQGNFGDDAAALMFGCALRDLGLPVLIYRLCAPYARAFGFEVASTPDELVRNVDVLVWGSGGLLIPWPSLTYRMLFPHIGEEFAEVVRLALAKGVRLIGSSVGGDGTCPARIEPSYKELFAASAAFLSVRNPQDLRLLERLGVPGAWHPDVLWLAAERLGYQTRKQPGLTIGLDLYPSNLIRRHAWYVLPLLFDLIRTRRDCNFVLLDTTNRSVKPYRGIGCFLSAANARNLQFSEPAADLKALASLDLLVSSRLHAPVVASACGVPCLSLFGEKKTRLLLSNLGREDLLFGHRRLAELLGLLRDRKKLDTFLRDFRFPPIEELRAGADLHFHDLAGQLQGPARR
jgi:polysaccharide pyruvyl transferase WcaK-like protein